MSLISSFHLTHPMPLQLKQPKPLTKNKLALLLGGGGGGGEGVVVPVYIEMTINVLKTFFVGTYLFWRLLNVSIWN